MRRLLAFIIGIWFILTCAILVSAEDGTYATAGEWYQDNAKDFPDYVCGAWSTDGGTVNLTVGILNNDAGNAGKEELLALIQDDTTISFVYQKYSSIELQRIRQALEIYFWEDVGLHGVGISYTGNCVVLSFDDDRENDAATRLAIEEIVAQYGDAVYIEFAPEPEPELAPKPAFDVLIDPLVPLFCVAGVVFMGAAVVILSRRRKLDVLLQTNYGTTATESVALSSKNVKKMVQQSNRRIPSGLDQRIMDAIDGL